MSSANHTLPRRIPSLDGLRALSIILVLIGHGGHSFSSQLGSLKPLLIFFGNSGLGVKTFFVISGFLITHLLRKEIAKSGTINIGEFYKRRVLRIFPAFYTYIAAVAILTIGGFISIGIVNFLCAGTFTWNYSQKLFGTQEQDVWYLGHFWTLALEEQFYIFWPVSLLFLGEKRATKLAIALICLAPISRLATYYLMPGMREQINMMLHTSADAMMIGCLASLWQGTERMQRFLEKIKSGVLPAVCAFLAFVVNPLLLEKFKGAYNLPVGYSLTILCVVVVMLWVVHFPETSVGRLLNSRPLVFVGVLSYSLYLWQQMFLSPFNKTLTGMFPLNFLFCFLAAMVSYNFIEQPFLRLKDRLPRQQPTKPEPEVSEILAEPQRSVL